MDDPPALELRSVSKRYRLRDGGEFAAVDSTGRRFSDEVEPLTNYFVARGQRAANGGADQFGFPGSPNVEGDLIGAMLANPHLMVEVENGVYDLATPFFATEQTMDHLGLMPNLRKNIRLQYYEAGHMMYVRDEDLAKLKTNVAAFIDAATKP